MCVAVPLKVKSVSGDWAELFLGESAVRARTDLVSVKEGDYVLVHAGFVIEKLDDQEAEKTIRMFLEREMLGGPRRSEGSKGPVAS